jgi:hypothetical protein
MQAFQEVLLVKGPATREPTASKATGSMGCAHLDNISIMTDDSCRVQGHVRHPCCRPNAHLTTAATSTTTSSTCPWPCAPNPPCLLRLHLPRLLLLLPCWLLCWCMWGPCCCCCGCLVPDSDYLLQPGIISDQQLCGQACKLVPQLLQEHSRCQGTLQAAPQAGTHCKVQHRLLLLMQGGQWG